MQRVRDMLVRLFKALKPAPRSLLLGAPLDLDTPEGGVEFWGLHLRHPEQELEADVRKEARMLGFRAYPDQTVPAAIMAIPQLHQSWVGGCNRAMLNARGE